MTKKVFFIYIQKSFILKWPRLLFGCEFGKKGKSLNSKNKFSKN